MAPYIFLNTDILLEGINFNTYLSPQHVGFDIVVEKFIFTFRGIFDLSLVDYIKTSD